MNARALPFALCAIAFAAPCAADDGGPVSRAAMERDMLSYYRGEYASGCIGMALGMTSVGVGGALVTRDGDLERGLGWTLLGLGAVESIGGVIYALQVNAEIRRYRALLAADPEGFQRIELEHIRGTRRRFIGYNLIEIGLTLGRAAVAAYGVLADSDVSKGVGIGLAAVGLPFFIIDSVNNVRARDYQNQVLRFLKRVSFVPAGTGRPWSLSFGGSF